MVCIQSVLQHLMCRTYPQTFVLSTDVQVALNDAIAIIDNFEKSQCSVDAAFNELCDVLKDKMVTKSTHITVTVRSSVTGNKGRRLENPWWNDTLNDLWNEVCSAEKAWLKCKNTGSGKLKQVYVSKGKTFDRHVHRFKRNYRLKVFENCWKGRGSRKKEIQESLWK
jgi:hypothetical protein